MPYSFPKNEFNLTDFMDDLMDKMGMQAAPAAEKEPLERAMEEQLAHVIMETAALYIEADVIEELSIWHAKEKDFTYFVSQLIRHSPRAQFAILAAIDQFYDQTLEAFNILNVQKTQ